MAQASPDPAALPTWDDLHRRIEATRDAWRAATHGLVGDEVPPATDDGEERWSAAQIHSHVARALLRYADALSQVAVSHAAVFDHSAQLLPGRHPYARIRNIGDKGWTDFLSAARTVAKQPERGPVIAYGADMLSARHFVQRGLAHLQQHIQQIRALRSDALTPASEKGPER